MKKLNLWLFAGLTLSLLTFAAHAFAAGPVSGEMTLQPAATPVMERITEFHQMLLYIITGICLFVFALVGFILLRFNAKANPEPSKTTHNTLLEIVWTVIPVVILIMIAIPSLKLLYYTDHVENPDMTIKVTGYQWYWNYTYVGEDDEFSFDSRLIDEHDTEAVAKRGAAYKRLLSADNQLVLPVDTNIQILVTGGPDDVIHSFAVPPFGIKVDAVPGRTNETWARITKPGTYYGQCSELCGKGHAFMPIEVKAVSKAEFKQWLEFAKKEYASYDDFKAQQTVQLAKAEEVE